MKTFASEKFQLNFDRNDVKLAVALPADISVSGAAGYVLSHLSKSIQREIVSLVVADKNGALKMPDEHDTYAAKTRKGYGVIYQKSDNKKTILHVVHPSELERFRTELQ